MEYQKQYYEIEDFWNTEPAGSDLERIQEVYKLIPLDVASVLDVGCGNGIFVNYVIKQTKKFKKVHAVDRSLTALKFVESEKTQASIESLPFDAGEFDLVVCLEVLEHLSQPSFQRALIELARVSGKYIIITVPNKQNLKFGQISCPSCFTRFNPDLHLHSFGIESLGELFTKQNFFCKEIKAICKVESYMMLSSFLKWKSEYQKLKNPLVFSLICPVCGASIPGKQQSNQRDLKTFKDILKRAWPKTYRKRYLIAIFERV